MKEKAKLNNDVIVFLCFVLVMTFVSLILAIVFARPVYASQMPNTKHQRLADKPEVLRKVIFPIKDKKVIEVKQEAKETKQLLGKFNITFYDLSVESCGKTANDPAYGVTYSGKTAKQGVTVAVDPKQIPLGTSLYIEGLGHRIAQDIGGGIKGNRIDVFVNKFEYGNKNMITGQYIVYKLDKAIS